MATEVSSVCADASELAIVDATNAPATSTPAAASETMIFLTEYLLLLNMTPSGWQTTL
jgi:hypothetical protein